MMWTGHEGWGWGFGFWHMLGFLIFLILVLAVLLRALGVWPGNISTPLHDSALGILKARYAKGEIDIKEYEEKKRVLGA